MQKQLFYILLFIGFIGFSQENEITISADTTLIRIGEQIQYKIGVNNAQNVVFPKLQLDSLGKIELVESLPTDTLKNKLEKKYLITSFDSGQYVLPKQLVLINNNKVYTDSLLINVATVKVDTLKQKMFPIKAIKQEPKTFDDYKYLLWWLLAAVLIIGLVLYFIFRKKEKKETPKVIIAPIQEALQRLKELDEKQLVKQHKIKIYYSELTNIVRTYIEKDLHIPALESTSNELIETIKDFNESSNLGISDEIIKELNAILQNADLVKFAKLNPFIKDITNDRKTTENIIKSTQDSVQLKASKEIENNAEPTIEINSVQPKKKSNLKKYIIGFVSVFMLLLGAAGYFGYKYAKKNIIGNSTEEMLHKKWYTLSYGYPPVKIETPEILQSKDVQIPENLTSVIKEQSTNFYGSLISNFYVAVTTINFVNDVDNFDFDKGIQGALNEIYANTGAEFSNIHQEIRVNNGVEGRIVTANFELENKITQQMESNKLTMLLFANNNSMRQVIVSQLVSDENAEAITDRIIQSVSLNP